MCKVDKNILFVLISFVNQLMKIFATRTIKQAQNKIKY